MAKYNGVRSNNYRGKNVGLNPTSDGKNRKFWHDRFVEPKQQHRFTVRMPIYTPVGRDKSTLKTAEYIKNNLGLSEEAKNLTQQIKDKFPTAQTRVSITSESNDITGVITSNSSLKNAKQIDARNIKNFVNINAKGQGDKLGSNISEKFDGKQVIKALGFGEQKTKGSLFNDSRFEYISNDNEIGLYLRVSEYIAFSFKPPGFGYTPTNIGYDGQRNPEFAEGSGDPSLGVANLTFVTTLRDDLHFSLGLLWALSTTTTEGDVKRSSFRLFPTALTGDLNDSRKELEIFEHYARQTKDGNGNSINGINDSNVSGIHRLKDPVIQSVDFSEYTYGGTELVKVSLTLGYDNGTSDDENKKINQSNFYSYQITEDRYGPGERGTVYAMDAGNYARATEPFQSAIYPSAGPIPGSKRYQLTYATPNTGSSNSDLRNLTFGQLKERKNALLIEKNIERLETRRILEGDSNIDKNNLVTKGISQIIAAREKAAEAALDDQRDRRFVTEAAREQLEQRQRSQQESDRRRQEIDNYIATTQARLDRERQQGAATPPTPADFDAP